MINFQFKHIDFTVSLDLLRQAQYKSFDPLKAHRAESRCARFTILKHIDPSADGRDALDSQFSGLGVVLKKC
jgi:hypothetical protein